MHPTPSLLRSIRRLALTTKQGPHNYYKGNRTGSQGRHTKHGGYIIDLAKVRTYVCPDLGGFGLTPFVARAKPKKPGSEFRQDGSTEMKSPVDGEGYLRLWKMGGGKL